MPLPSAPLGPGWSPKNSRLRAYIRGIGGPIGGWKAAAWAFFLYLALSVLFFGRHVVANLGTSYVGQGGDPAAIIWFLKWWPYALGHHMNPFVTHLVWAPDGANLAAATSIPGLAFVATPLTLLAGPIVSYNVLFLTAPAVSGWSMFLLARYLTRSGWAALFAGYVYGFSSYVIGKMLGHLHLAMAFIPPVVVLLVVKRVDGRIGRRPFVLLLASTLVAQFLISTEAFFTMTLFGAIALGLAVLLAGGERTRPLLNAGVSILGSYAITGVVLIPYLYYVVRGLSQPPIYDFYSTFYVTDPLNFVMPTLLTQLWSVQFLSLTSRFTGNLSEQGAYLGPPLLAIVGWYGSRAWRTRTGKLLLGMFGLLCVLSLGPRLSVLGRTHIPLPWRPMAGLPLVKYALPARFSQYVALVVAVVAGLWLSDPGVPRWAKGTLMALAVAYLLPAWSSPVFHTEVYSPAFFTSQIHRNYLRQGDNVVILPYGDRGYSMLWQTQADFWFRMAEGYVSVVPPRPFQKWPILKTFYDGVVGPRSPSDLRAFLAAHDVRAVIVASDPEGSWSGLLRTIDAHPRVAGGVTIYRVPQ